MHPVQLTCSAEAVQKASQGRLAVQLSLRNKHPTSCAFWIVLSLLALATGPEEAADACRQATQLSLSGAQD